MSEVLGGGRQPFRIALCSACTPRASSAVSALLVVPVAVRLWRRQSVNWNRQRECGVPSARMV